jgi:DNA repair protein RadC
VQTVKYQELIPMLLNELQRQHQVLQTQQQALQSQQQALQLQQQELAELRALVGQGRGKVVFGGMVE